MTSSGGDPARAALDAEIMTWLREPAWREDEARFERLALALFAFQFEHCPPYRRFCEGRGHTPRSVRSWRAVPPVPAGAFKAVELRSFDREYAAHSFRTSGTSGEARGVLQLDTLALYEASLLPAFTRHVLPDLDDPATCPVLRVIAPSPDDVPDSSLSHMFGVVLRELGVRDSGFDVAEGAICTDRLVPRLVAAAESDEPLVLCGTAFAFVHLVDALGERDLALSLPAGSRVMETGGFKGRARERTRDELYAQIQAALGIPAQRIVNQYGMTELASQFYDSVLCEPDAPRRKLGPPWTRVRIVDARHGGEAAPGEVGTIVVYDLANTGSVLAVQTGDLGRRAGDGFELIGREPGAEARGCSIAADEMLAGGSP